MIEVVAEVKKGTCLLTLGAKASLTHPDEGGVEVGAGVVRETPGMKRKERKTNGIHCLQYSLFVIS